MNPTKATDDIFPIEEEAEENDQDEQDSEDLEENSKMDEEKELTEGELELKLLEDPNSLQTIILLIEAYKTSKQQEKLSHLRQDAQKKFMLPEGFSPRI